MVESKRNLALSGWSGAGTTTTTLLLADLLSRKYYYLGSVFRYFGRSIANLKGNVTEDEWLSNNEQKIQPYLGKVIDQYVDHKLTTDKSGFILETDISAFRLGKRKAFYSIFIKTDFETRLERFTQDQRSGDQDTLKQRDIVLQKEYQKLWDIDIFDEVLIKEKFDTVINNSNLGVRDTVLYILNILRNVPQFTDEVHEIRPLDDAVNELVDFLEAEGKQGLQKRLTEKKLLVTPEQIIKEIKELYTEEIKDWPDDLQKVIHIVEQ